MLIIGISGKALSAEEENWLCEPAVCGAILFARNFESRPQLQRLIQDIRRIRPGPFVICVDQEGGPVQRFREGFSILPALSCLGQRYDFDAAGALDLAEKHAWLMATEILALGLDISFVPVVDLKRGNRAIGERAFHADPAVVAAFGAAYVRGMKKAGMAATLKHFPGHGSILEDTHFDVASDARTFDTIASEDLYPFHAGIAAGADAVMMAHVKYPLICADPAGYSKHWIRDILQAQMKFTGIVFSDDIGMAAAESVGGVKSRIEAHLEAGCDIVLVCAPALVTESIAALRGWKPITEERLSLLMPRQYLDWDRLIASDEWEQTRQTLDSLTVA